MFPKGVETGLLEFHPLAMVEYKAVTRLKTTSVVLTSTVGKAKFLNIFMVVSFPIRFDVCERLAPYNLQMINRLKTRQL